MRSPVHDPLVTSRRYDVHVRLQGSPTGWYAIAFSTELARGAVLRRAVMDRALVVFRTVSGAIAALDAYCPHLGAHLAEGGEVHGETLRCPFHGFRFDVEGRCVSTPYDCAVPKLRTGAWAVRERHGVVLVWLGPTRVPAWELAPIEPEHARRAWSEPVGRLFRIRTHPQEIIENTVDVGHFTPVHGYRRVEVTAPLAEDGPHLSMGYVVTRERGLLGRFDPNPFRMRLAIRASGLGYSRVQVTHARLPLALRTVVMPTPVGEDELEVRVVTQAALVPEVRVDDVRGPRRVLARIAADALAYIAAEEMARDFVPDIRVWENKRFEARPGLAVGDGPIAAYRRWASQFADASTRLLPLA